MEPHVAFSRSLFRWMRSCTLASCLVIAALCGASFFACCAPPPQDKAQAFQSKTFN